MWLSASAFACDLGIDEGQIEGAGGFGAATSTAGPGGATSSSSMAASTVATAGNGTTSTGTGTASTTASTTTSGMPPTAQVMCAEGGGQGLVRCRPGQVCCVSSMSLQGSCADDCSGGEYTFACDGPEDCPGAICCATNVGFGDVECRENCSDDNTVCKSNADCADLCVEPFPPPYGDAYMTCF